MASGPEDVMTPVHMHRASYGAALSSPEDVMTPVHMHRAGTISKTAWRYTIR